MAAQVDGIPAAAIERYDAVIATRPGIERKGASMPYTSTNGHMFSFLTPEGTLALRLSTSDRKRVPRIPPRRHRRAARACPQGVRGGAR